MTTSLQQGIQAAGSPMALLWEPGARPWLPPVIAPAYRGWRTEQAAPMQSVALSDLSHHMSDLRIEGPDATWLLSECSANNYESFAIGQAKQFIAVTPRGHLVSDGILLREDQQRYTLTGAPASQNWVRHHGERGTHSVTLETDPDTTHRGGADPVVFRFQIQGPLALALAERVFGGPMPETKFFHSTSLTLDGRPIRALRHGMTGQPGFELIGPYADGAFVKEALLSAGAEFDIVPVGALAYSTNPIESGWIPTQAPGIYTGEDLRGYREWLPLDSYEGQRRLHGSLFSEDVEEYYVNPYELGYGRSVSFNHDFIGRDALERARDNITRTKVTLVLNPEDVRDTFGDELGFMATYGSYRIEHDGVLIGRTCELATIGSAPQILGLALVDSDHSAPGTEVSVSWGEHPGPGTEPGAPEPAFPEIRATVQPSPYNEFARTQYRQDAVAGGSSR